MEKSLLDTTSIKAAYRAETLEFHERFGAGEVYQFGVTKVEVYPGTDISPPVARIRAPGGVLAFADLSEVKPTQDGGVLIDCAKQGQKPHCSINISKSGEIAFLYAPPPAPMRFSENGVLQHIGGNEYQQTSIDIEGTPEGVRVQVRGTVDAAPRLLVVGNQKSPLVFFLIEHDPEHPDKPVYHEVWAVSKPRQELKALKLVKGVEIEAILYRHTIETELESHKKITLVRHNLVKVITARGHSAKRPRMGQQTPT